MNQLQINLFQVIKTKIPSNFSFVDEIADVLQISNDSAYRRIRGEKEISFEEIQKLSNRFNVSIDQVLSLKNDSMLFSGKFIDPLKFDFLGYLDEMYNNVAYITSFQQKELINFSKDIPVFYYYMFPELAAFKFFVWMRTLLKIPEYTSRRFALRELGNQFLEKAEKIASMACRIPTTEILNVENILTTLRQIEYYKDMSLFASVDEMDLVYNKLLAMIDHMEQLCSTGKKYMPGQKPVYADGILKMYVNDFVIGDNSNMVLLDGKKMCYINHNVMHFMITRNEAFCNYTYDFIQNIIQKSNLISEVAERERAIFFNMIRHRIDLYKHNGMKTLTNPSSF